MSSANHIRFNIYSVHSAENVDKPINLIALVPNELVGADRHKTMAETSFGKYVLGKEIMKNPGYKNQDPTNH